MGTEPERRISYRQTGSFIADVAYKLTPDFLRAAGPDHWKDANTWLWYTLFGGTLPFWAPLILFLFFDRSLSIARLVEGGELALFSAGLLASAIPVMRRRVKDAPVEHPEWFFRVSLLSFAAVVIMLTATTLAREFGLPGFRGSTVAWVSLVVFAVSIFIGYAVELINNIRLFPNIRGVQEAQMDELEAKFARRLGHD